MAKELDATEPTADDTAMAQAFAASFSEADVAEAKPEEAKPVVDTVVEEVKAEVTPQAPPALSEQQMKLLQAIPELERRLTQQVDRVSGNYGEIKRLVDEMKKASATPKGAAAFEASPDSDALDEFPELAQGVDAKIARRLATFQTGMTPEQVRAQYAEERRQEKEAELSQQLATLQRVHPDHIEIQQTPQWEPWLKTLDASDREGVMQSFDPYYVSSMISKFKAYRDRKVAEASKDKLRVDRAVSPNGVRPTSPSTINEDEAMRQAFAQALTS